MSRVVERLVIVHTTLTHICTGRPTLDETAWNDELLEQVVLYHHHHHTAGRTALPLRRTGTATSFVQSLSSSSSSSPSSSSAAATTATSPQSDFVGNNSRPSLSSRSDENEVIQFVGLCLALYQLPKSINATGNDAKQQDATNNTQVVHLQNSSLVFVPLDEDQGDNDDSHGATTRILAVVQMSQSHHSNAMSPQINNTLSHVAVRRALQRTHASFCLWRGGGIHERLKSSSSSCAPPRDEPWYPLLHRSNDPSSMRPSTTFDAPTTTTTTPPVSSSCLYPGMDDLYRWRKQLRTLSETATRQECDELVARIRQLTQTMPMTSLRRDLELHYREFCHTNNDSSCSSSAATLSETSSSSSSWGMYIPPPMPTRSGDHLRYSAPVRVSALAQDLIHDSLQQLVSESAHGTGLTTDNTVSPRTSQSNNQLLGVTCFARGQLFMPTITSSHTPFTLVKEPTTNTLLGYSMALVQWQVWDHCCSRFRDSSAQTTPGQRNSPRKSTSPLKPFALSFVSDDMNDPLLRRNKHSPEAGFLSPPPLSFLRALDEANAFADSRGEAQVWAPPVSLPVQRLHHHNNGTSDARMVTSRLNARICWFSRGDFSFLCFLRCSPEDKQETTGYVDLFTKIEAQIARVLDAVEQSSRNDSPVIPPVVSKMWEVSGQDIVAIDRRTQSLTLFTHHASSIFENGKNDSIVDVPVFDCRYRLIAHLSPESLRAIVDGMEEVSRFHEGNKHALGESHEICTLLTNHRWFYTFAQGTNELYVLFDTALFVTVADVRHAAGQIRTELLT